MDKNFSSYYEVHESFEAMGLHKDLLRPIFDSLILPFSNIIWCCA